MMPVPALADRAARLSLGALCLFHALLFAALFAGMVLAAGGAHAAAACTGNNLLTALERDAPQKLAALRVEAAAVENGRGTLWRVSRPGVPDSFLFGTMHVTDPRVTALAPAARKAFDGAGMLVIETTDVLDEAGMMAALMADPALTMFTDGSTLSQHLSPADAAALEKGLDARGIPLGSVARMKPWVLSAALSLPACELARKASGAPVLDVSLGREAKAAGKRVEGLETARSQLEAMASLPLDFHVRGLVETLKLGSRLDDVIETMIAVYESGETGLFWPLLNAVMPDSAEEPGYAAFEETMITARNRGMAEKAAPFLAEGGAFVAVGALHLPGPEGLVALLKRRGFALAAVE